jgi:hypothetical protein
MPVVQITDSATTLYQGASKGGDGQPNPVVGHIGIWNITPSQPVIINAWFDQNKPDDDMGKDPKSDMTYTLNGGQAIRVGGSFVTAYCDVGKTAMVELF